MKSLFKLFLLALALPLVVTAQDVELKKDVVGSGGVLNATVQTTDSETITMSGTFGQVAVAKLGGESSTSENVVYEGYWGPMAKIPGSVDPKPELFDAVGLKNYPNPVSVSTTISFNLPESGNVTLRVFDVNGNMVAQLANNDFQGSGENTIEWNLDGQNGLEVTSGSYLYELSVEPTSGSAYSVRNIMVVSK